MSYRRNIPNGYTLIPNALLFDPRLSDAELRVLMALRAHDFAQKGTGKRKGTVWPSWAALSECTGKSRKTIYRVTKGLEAKGYIEKLRGGGHGVPNLYRLVDDGALYDPAQNGVKNDTLSEYGVKNDQEGCQKCPQNGVKNDTRNIVRKKSKETEERPASSFSAKAKENDAEVSEARGREESDAVTGYELITGRKLTPTERKRIEDVVFDEGWWLAVVWAWKERGYRLEAVEAILDAYENGPDREGHWTQGLWKCYVARLDAEELEQACAEIGYAIKQATLCGDGAVWLSLRPNKPGLEEMETTIGPKQSWYDVACGYVRFQELRGDYGGNPFVVLDYEEALEAVKDELS